MSDRHATFMKEALRLAARGGTAVRPNPLVGCIVVRDGQIVGRGWHRRHGGAHAEVNALQQAGEKAHGATVYVTLEPCNHHGHTPPCTAALIQAGVAEVVIAMRDPNPHVAGGGCSALQHHGITCTTGICEAEARALNRVFLMNVLHERPFVTLKVAQTLDGFIIPSRGRERWITGGEAIRDVHRLRSLNDGILVGAGTVRVDNPRLDVRHGFTGSPHRIVLSAGMSLPPSARLLSPDATVPTWIITGRRALEERRDLVAALASRGVEFDACAVDSQGKVRIRPMLEHLYRKGIGTLLVEGGAEVFSAFLRARMVDQLDVYIAPKVLGRGTPAFAHIPVRTLTTAEQFLIASTRQCGSDMHLVLHPRS